MAESAPQQMRILLVEDDPGDALITTEAMRASDVPNEVRVVEDGEAALAFLRAASAAERPHLVLLDLNLPRVSGLEVLAAMKADPDLRSIPVVVLTTSSAEEDVVRSYDRHANAFITKPVDFDRFTEIVRRVEDFYRTVATLPAS